MDQGSGFWYAKSSLKTCPLRNEQELCRPIWNLVATADKKTYQKKLMSKAIQGKAVKYQGTQRNQNSGANHYSHIDAKCILPSHSSVQHMGGSFSEKLYLSTAVLFKPQGSPGCCSPTGVISGYSGKSKNKASTYESSHQESPNPQLLVSPRDCLSPCGPSKMQQYSMDLSLKYSPVYS